LPTQKHEEPLLPYVEQEPVYQSMLTDVPADYLSTTALYPEWWTYPSMWQAAQARVALFLCPSDNAYANVQGTLVTMQSLLYPGYIDIDASFFSIGNGGDNLGRTNYVGVSGYAGLGAGSDGNAGPLANRSNVTLAQIASADGASTTALFGEYLGDTNTSPRNYSASWMGVGALPTWPGLPTTPSTFTFGSMHPGIVQFCFCDGSVRSLRTGADYNNYLYATGWMDGQIVDWSAIEN